MLNFNRLSVLLLIIFSIQQMSTETTKTCWPELVGKTADEAVKVIKEESGRKKQKQNQFEILFH